MSAGAGRHRDDAVDAGFRRLLGMTQADHVVKDQTTIAVHGLDQIGHRAERGDDQRHLVLDGDLKIGLHPRIGAVHDQVDAERRGIGRARSAVASISESHSE